MGRLTEALRKDLEALRQARELRKSLEARGIETDSVAALEEVRTPVSDSALVAAVQAQGVDADERARAIYDLRSAVDEDDYKLMTGLAGDLGGAELWEYGL